MNNIKNVIVTGGYGFIGSNWIIQNHKKFNILNIDNLSTGSDINNLRNIDASNYSHLKMSITDSFLFDYIDSRGFVPDALVHFAAESHVDRSIDSPSNFFHTNVMGTVNLLDVLRKLNPNARFMHISTDEVFGHLQANDPPFNETTPYNPRSPYSASKASSDMAVKAYNQTYDMDTVISNTCNNFGPRQHKEKLIPTVITNIINGKAIPVYGTGTNIREWLSVFDHCEGITEILLNGKKGESYCLGSHLELTNIDLIKNIVSICKDLNINTYNSAIKYIEDRKGHDFRYAIDSSKAMKELNWIPKRDFKNSLRETILWYANNEL